MHYSVIDHMFREFLQLIAHILRSVFKERSLCTDADPGGVALPSHNVFILKFKNP